MVTIPKGNNILTYLQKQEINITAPCNGIGKCGKCKIKVISPFLPCKEDEKSLLTKQEIEQGVRLACMHITKKDTLIDVCSSTSSMQILDQFEMTKMTSAYHRVNEKIYLNDVEIANLSEALGIAIDIGTTTVVVLLVDLVSTKIIDALSFINPQTRFGNDVISRIQYASHHLGLETLHNLICQKLNDSIQQLLNKHQLSKAKLLDISVVGNTTMNHLLLNVDPSSMATYPFKASVLKATVIQATEIFPSLDPKTTLHLLPSLDAFVGADITGGLYAKMMHTSSQFNLLIDLGTNGEMVIGNQTQMIATSTAAGPAFEGVNITCGLGAIPGGLSTFTMKDIDTFAFDTIEQAPILGICGSGLIDLVAALLKHNIINETGYMKEPFYITPQVYLTPKDVRQLQLAKSAIRTGVEVLLTQAGVRANQIENVYIAGGFGKHINVDHLFFLGILPSSFINKVKVIGNSALHGAYKALLNPSTTELEKIVLKTKTISLSEDQAFQDLFVSHMHFRRNS